MFPQSAYSGPEIPATARNCKRFVPSRSRRSREFLSRGGKQRRPSGRAVVTDLITLSRAPRETMSALHENKTTAARRAVESTGISIRKENFILLQCERLYRARSIIIFSLAQNWGNNGVRARINNVRSWLYPVHHGNSWRFLLRFRYIRRGQSILTRSHFKI